MINKKVHKLFNSLLKTLLFLGVLSGGLTQAQVAKNYNGGQLVQNFLTLNVTPGPTYTFNGSANLQHLGVVNSALEGWHLYSNAQAISSYVEEDGDSSSWGYYAYGSPSSPDLALGMIGVNFGTLDARIGLILKNNTSEILDRLYIRYKGEQWRDGTPANPLNPDEIRCHFLLTSTPNDITGSITGLYTITNTFTAPNNNVNGTTYNGNDSLNSEIIEDFIPTSVSSPSIQWQPNQYLIVVFQDYLVSGPNDGLAIDDFEFSAVSNPIVNPVSVCSGTNASLLISNYISGTTYNCYASATGGTPLSSTLNNTITVTPTGNTTYYIEAKIGDLVSKRTPVAVSIVSTPSITTPVSDQIKCFGASISAITFTGPVPGTIYSWTNNQTGIGLAASGATSVPAFITTNSGNTPLVGTITVTPYFTNTNIPLTCPGTPKGYNITVNPLPTIDNVSDKTVCLGNAISSINFTGTVPGTAYSWTSSNNAIGMPSSGTTSIAQFTPINTGNAPVSTTITVTPKYSNITVCNGQPLTFDITVNPTPSISNMTGDQKRCHGDSTSNISVTGPVVGTVYSWTNSHPSITPASVASGAGNIASFPPINTGNAGIIAKIIYTPQFTNNDITCYGMSDSATITVNPIPDVEVIPDQVYCKGIGTQEIIFTGFVNDATYSWTISNSSSIGAQPNGIDKINPFVPVNSTNTAITSTVTVSPKYTFNSKTCNGTSKNFTITVNPNAIVDAGEDTSVCANGQLLLQGSTRIINGDTLGATWSATQGGGFSNTSDFNATFTPSSPEGFDIIRLTTADPDGAGPCPSEMDEIFITIRKVPVFTPDNQYMVESGKSLSLNLDDNCDTDAKYNWEWTVLEGGVTENVKTGTTQDNLNQGFTNFKNATSLVQYEVIPSKVYTASPNDTTTCIGDMKTFKVKVVPVNGEGDLSGLLIPDAFSPNGDGKNDSWMIEYLQNVNPNDFKVEIYNRAGALITSSETLDISWNGENGLDGTYWYVIYKGGKNVKMGDFLLIR